MGQPQPRHQNCHRNHRGNLGNWTSSTQRLEWKTNALGMSAGDSWNTLEGGQQGLRSPFKQVWARASYRHGNRYCYSDSIITFKYYFSSSKISVFLCLIGPGWFCSLKSRWPPGSPPDVNQRTSCKCNIDPFLPGPTCHSPIVLNRKQKKRLE